MRGYKGMPDFFKSIKITQPTPGGPLVEQVIGAVQVSTGTAADAGKLVVTDSSGKIDGSMVSGSTISVNGSPVTNPDFNGSAPSPGLGYSAVIWTTDVGGDVSAWYSTTGSSVSFNDITNGTNMTATMEVGTGATLSFTGTGVVNANQINAIDVSGNSPTHAGQLLISQPGNTTALWADPQVQGLYDTGSTISPAPAYVAPTNIQPILIGGSDGTTLRNILTDSGGHLIVIGSLTHNNTAPAANNMGALVGVASSGSPTYNTGDQVLLSTDLQGNLRVTSAGTFTPALTADRTATGTITSTQNVTVSTAGGGTAIFNITGTWTGTIVFEGSVDGTNWVTADVQPFQFGSLISSVVANGQWLLNVGGLNSFRVRGNTVATGTATVWIEVGAGANAVTIQDIIQGTISVNNFPATQTVSGNVTAAQGSANTIANSWPIEVTDGTNVLFTSTHPGDINLTQINGSAVSTAASGIMRIGVTAGDTGTLISSTSDSGTVGLNVHVTNTGGLAGTQYLEGTTAATPTGTVAMTKNPSNLIESLRSDASSNLLVSVNTALPAGANIIGKAEVTDGTNILFTTSHPGITQDVSDGTPGLAVPATAMFMAGKDNSTGFLHGLSTDSSGVLNVNASVSGSFTPALTADRTASGTLTTINGAITVSTQGVSGVVMNVVNDTTAWTGTLAFEASPDGTNWYPVFVYAKFPSGAAVQTTSANGQWTVPAGGLNSFRIRASTTIAGGTGAKIWIEAGAGALLVEVAQNTASNLNTTDTQGTCQHVVQRLARKDYRRYKCSWHCRESFRRKRSEHADSHAWRWYQQHRIYQLSVANDLSHVASRHQFFVIWFEHACCRHWWSDYSRLAYQLQRRRFNTDFLFGRRYCNERTVYIHCGWW